MISIELIVCTHHVGIIVQVVGPKVEGAHVKILGY